jgi:hypothetical protein
MWTTSTDNEVALHHRILEVCQTISNYPGIFEGMPWSMLRSVEVFTETHGGRLEHFLQMYYWESLTWVILCRCPLLHNTPDSGAYYSSAYQVLSRRERSLPPVTVSTDRVKLPTYSTRPTAGTPPSTPQPRQPQPHCRRLQLPNLHYPFASSASSYRQSNHLRRWGGVVVGTSYMSINHVGISHIIYQL